MPIGVYKRVKPPWNKGKKTGPVSKEYLAHYKTLASYGKLGGLKRWNNNKASQPEEKRCIRCKKVKPKKKFLTGSGCFTERCRNCRKARRKELMRLRPYGLTPKKYKRMLRLQKSHCAICFRSKKLVIDHDHETGKVRSLLCYRCNLLVGLVEKYGYGNIRHIARYLKVHAQ